MRTNYLEQPEVRKGMKFSSSSDSHLFDMFSSLEKAGLVYYCSKIIFFVYYSVRIQTLENKWAPGSTGGPEFEQGESRIVAHTFFLTNYMRGNDSVHNKHRTSAFITSL